MSGVNPGRLARIFSPVGDLGRAACECRGPAVLVSMARGIGTTLGISLMALALHLGGADRGYAESTQARPAFIVLAVVSAAAAAIALAGRAQARGQAGRPREADPSGGFS